MKAHAGAHHILGREYDKQFYFLSIANSCSCGSLVATRAGLPVVLGPVTLPSVTRGCRSSFANFGQSRDEPELLETIVPCTLSGAFDKRMGSLGRGNRAADSRLRFDLRIGEVPSVFLFCHYTVRDASAGPGSRRQRPGRH